VPAIVWGISTLVLVIVILDQLVWRPLLAWGERFKLAMVESERPSTSWLYDVLRSSYLMNWLNQRIWHPAIESLDRVLLSYFPMTDKPTPASAIRIWSFYLLEFLAGTGLFYGVLRAGQVLLTVPLRSWGSIGLGIGATLLRVLVALSMALVWTVPLGVAIGTNPRLATWLQPLVQIAASVPSTALFPIVLLALLDLPGGLKLAAVLLMLMGTQWYLLFNTIAGATAIPQDLKYTTALLQLRQWKRWRTLILPTLFPYIITGAITASGGAWNASIVAEHVGIGGKTLYTTGIGALIAEATANGDYPLLLAATLSMVLTVTLINRLVWRRLYRLAEEQYRME
jgi:NitT/TauT family transport system permease protein